METHAGNTFKVAEVLQDPWDHLPAKLDLTAISQFLSFTGEGAEDPVWLHQWDAHSGPEALSPNFWVGILPTPGLTPYLFPLGVSWHGGHVGSEITGLSWKYVSILEWWLTSPGAKHRYSTKGTQVAA